MKTFAILPFFVLCVAKMHLPGRFLETRTDSDKANRVIDFNSPDTAILNLLILQYTNKEREKEKFHRLHILPSLPRPPNTIQGKW